MPTLPRILTGAAALLLGAVSQGALAQDDTNRFVMITHGQAADPFWSIVKKGAEDAAEDIGVELEYRAPTTFDVARMQQLFEAALASRPDGLIVTLTSPDALGGLMQEASNSGLPVIAFNSGGQVARDYGADVYIGMNEFLAGKMAAERMIENGATKGLCINHEQGNIGLDQRCEGFLEGFQGDAAQLATNIDPTAIRNSLTAYLNRNQDIDALLTLGPLGAGPVIDALESQGALGQFQFGTFDLSPRILETVANGDMDFAIDQQPYLQGYQSVITANEYVEHLLMPATDLLTGPAFVTPDTAERVMELSDQGIR